MGINHIAGIVMSSPLTCEAIRSERTKYSRSDYQSHSPVSLVAQDLSPRRWVSVRRATDDQVALPFQDGHGDRIGLVKWNGIFFVVGRLAPSLSSETQQPLSTTLLEKTIAARSAMTRFSPLSAASGGVHTQCDAQQIKVM